MEQPEHRKNAGEITAVVNFIIDALVLFFSLLIITLPFSRRQNDVSFN